MPLIQVLIALIVVGVLLWLVNTYIPMQSTIKSILNGVVVIVRSCTRRMCGSREYERKNAGEGAFHIVFQSSAFRCLHRNLPLQPFRRRPSRRSR